MLKAAVALEVLALAFLVAAAALASPALEAPGWLAAGFSYVFALTGVVRDVQDRYDTPRTWSTTVKLWGLFTIMFTPLLVIPIYIWTRPEKGGDTNVARHVTRHELRRNR